MHCSVVFISALCSYIFELGDLPLLKKVVLTELIADAETEKDGQTLGI